MPSFTFKGFATGDAVALVADQDGASASGAVSAWNDPGGSLADLDIQVVEQSVLTAPAMMVLGAVPGAGFTLSTPPAGTPYAPWRHEITYVWTVRHAPLSFERAPFLNMPTVWKNANLYYGPEAMIVFDQPGTYHVDLIAVDRNGVRGQTSFENIQIGSADDAFPGGATIAVSPSSDFTGAPSGATTIDLGSQNWTDVQAAIDARADADTRVVMRSGADFRGPITVGDQFDFSRVWSSNVMVGAFGTGPKPILPLPKHTGGSDRDVLFRLPRDNVAGGAKFHNLDMRGAWEADKERGYIGASPLWRDIRTDALFQRCRISGHNTVETQARNGDCYFVWSDGEVTNWGDMGLYLRQHVGGIKRHGVIGSDIVQHPGARQGRNKTGFQNQHGPMRCEDNNHLHLHVVDCFSRNGWSTGFASISADQPCIRINSDGTADANTVGDRLSLEGGFQILNITGQNPGTSTPDAPGNHVFDKLLTLGTAETQWHIHCKFGGTTVRNALAVEFNTPKFSGGFITGMYEFVSDDDLIPANRITPVQVYNSTLINLMSSTNHRALNTGGPDNVTAILENGSFSNFDALNIITYMPNQNAPDVVTPVETSASFPDITPRFRGIAESIQEITVNGAGTGSDTVVVPYSLLTDKNGNATSQAFWQAREAAGSTLHQVAQIGQDKLYSDLDEITVTYQANGAHIRRLDGTAFTNGANLRIKLDQSDTLDPPDPTYDITGLGVPLANLQVAAAAGGGIVAADRFDLSPRPGSGLPGAPGGTPRKGAI